MDAPDPGGEPASGVPPDADPEGGGPDAHDPGAEPEGTEPEGGDPACWLDQVCPACGRLSERTAAGRCASCGQAWDVD